jgi:hypothetical protein
MLNQRRPSRQISQYVALASLLVARKPSVAGRFGQY